LLTVVLVQVDARLQLNGEFVAACIEDNPFPPPVDAALTAAAPTEADHEVSTQISTLRR
jgi:hypothetical protein